MLLGFEAGPIKEIFLWSDFDSPAELRDKWLLAFEAAARTIRVKMSGPTNDDEWVLRFTDLEKPTRSEGIYEEYVYRLRTHFQGRLWEIFSSGTTPLYRTIGALVQFIPKLGYATFPPDFVKDLIESYSPHQELTAFKAERDYFTIEVGNPSERIRENFARMSYRSSNVPEDFVILVEKKPVGSLLLTSADFKITYHSSAERTCKIRLEMDGKLSQVGKGDNDIFLEIRKRVLTYLLNQAEKALLSTPTDQIEIIKDRESGIEITSREIVQQSKPIVVKLSYPIDHMTRNKLLGLFTHSFGDSKFFGTTENESESGILIRTTDTQGGGDAVLEFFLLKDLITIYPQPTTTIRTVARIHNIVLQKIDVDALLAYKLED